MLRRSAVVAKVTAADTVKVVEELTRDETVTAEVTLRDRLGTVRQMM
ncbi:DUF6192 family protein [Streptomyces sp. NPDC040750]